MNGSHAVRHIGAAYIDGAWRAPIDGSETSSVIEPHSESVIGTVGSASAVEVRDAVMSAACAGDSWAALTPGERTAILSTVIDRMQACAEEFIDLEVRNAGKPITAVREMEWPGLLDSARFFVGAARSLTAPAAGSQLPQTTTVVRREPVGVVAAITPWNYPLLQALAKIIPALAVGNTVVVKPSEVTPLSTARFVELAGETLPPGALNLVNGRGPDAGEMLVRNPMIDLVSFTGSVAAGQRVAAIAAQGSKRVILELGGNAPVIVFDDVDLGSAVPVIAGAGLYNAGQECMSATRILVCDSRYDELIAALEREVALVEVGDPTDPKTVVGPLVSHRQLARVVGYIQDRPPTSRVVIGGTRSARRPGYYLAPTIITDLEQHDDLVQEEIFGPVFTVQRFRDESEAVRLANGTRYGLAASVWTRDVALAHRVANALHFGTVWVNEHLVFGPDLPVTGYKSSGYGTECSSLGIQELTRTKLIAINTG